MTRNIAARPPAIFAVVSDIAHWPQIFGAVRNIEPLTDGPVREGTSLRENPVMFGLMTPLMQIVLRDEMEKDLADLAAAVSSRMSVTERGKQ